MGRDDVKNGNNKKNKKVNQDAEEVDYPYVCSSGALFDNVISVQTNILAARQRAKAMVIGNKNGTNNLSVALMASLVALATFIGLSVITLFYKKKIMKKVLSSSSSEESMLNDEES